MNKHCLEAIAIAVMALTPDTTVLAGGGTLEELEIVAGHVWSAVGGADNGEVSVHQVDPSRYGVEIAPATAVDWVTGQEGDPRNSVLSTLRPFKPMDMVITERVLAGDGTVAVVSGLTDITEVEINGVNQFNSKNDCPSVVFGSVLSAPRPKIRFDTVQTSPALTMGLVYVGGTIAASATARVTPMFSGVAVKR
jgi:hypothetical protein